MSKKSADTMSEVIAAMQRTRALNPIPKPQSLNVVTQDKLESSAAPDDLQGALPLASLGGNKKVIKIAVELLDESPSQYRLTYPGDELDALGATLLQGQVEPIKVRAKSDGRFELITGHRRTRAAKNVGIKTLDAIVVAVDDKRAAIELILANESQESVGDFERATGYRNLMDFGMLRKEVADALGIDKSLVSHRLRFFDLPKEVLDVLAQYPRAFSHNTVPVLCDFIKNSPEMLEDVVEGVRRVGVGDWTPQSLITVLRQRQKLGTSAAAQEVVLAIADLENHPVLTMQAKKNGRVEIQLQKDIDQNLFMKHFAEIIRDAVSKIEVVTSIRKVD
jgi:ParB/RepB/Spo0J family partition protein